MHNRALLFLLLVSRSSAFQHGSREMHGCLTSRICPDINAAWRQLYRLRGSGSAAHPGTKCVINNWSADWMPPGCYRNNNEAIATRCDRMIAVWLFFVCFGCLACQRPVSRQYMHERWRCACRCGLHCASVNRYSHSFNINSFIFIKCELIASKVSCTIRSNCCVNIFESVFFSGHCD